MKRHFYLYLILLSLFAHFQALAGKKQRVLFLGNSYTHVNNMPQILADIATSIGDTLIWDMEAPGGFSLQGHCSTSATINKIKQGNWDYVVLQDQSQTPALPNDFVATGFFPYVRKLDSMIDMFNPCAQTLFYMTWGRKNSDASMCNHYTVSFNWPHYCSYNAMDSVLRLRYMMAADSVKGAVAPASAVWRYIRAQYPSINLYDPDESHPSAAGSYAAALSFYTAIFRKDPSLVTHNYTLSSTDAANIRNAAKKVAYDSLLYWHIGQHNLDASFTQTISGLQVNFTNTSVNATGHAWNFGNGQTSTATNPQHTYQSVGIYTIMLASTNQQTNCRDTVYNTIYIPMSVESIDKEKLFTISPNPANGTLYLSSELFLSGTYTLRLLNSTGQVVFDTKSKSLLEQSIDISSFSIGMYFVSVTNNEGEVYNGKFVKQ